MILLDTHTHLYLEEFDSDIHEVIKRAEELSVKYFIVPNIDSTSIEPMMKLCKEFSGKCFPAIGLHPQSVKENFLDELHVIESWLEKEKFVAIGEVGIDLYWDKTFFNQQVEALKFQLLLAKKYDLPVIIHSRDALNEIIQILNDKNFKDIKVVFHCFSGSTEQAEYLTKKGYKLGIGGVVTYNNAGLAKIVKELPLEHIVLETDSPYLPPVPYRGQRNESSYVRTIGEFIAQIKSCHLEEVAEVTTSNAKKFFKML